MARADLQAIHQIILEGHPGVIDEQNPGFKDWMEQGYQAALEKAPRVASYADFMAVLRWYVSGFQDGHLDIQRDAEGPSNDTTRGWFVVPEAGSYRVRVVLSDWPVPLPPLGAEWLGCDGRSADQILDTDVAPYTDRRPIPALRPMTALVFSLPPLRELNQQQCSFNLQDGSVQRYEQRYQQISLQGPPSAALVAAVADVQALGDATGPDYRQERHNRMERLPDGTLWIRLGIFDPEPADAPELNTLLEQLSRQRKVKRIVFDVRGNRGGSSSVGSRVFEPPPAD